MTSIAAVPPVPVRKFTVDEYHAMARAGILGEKDAVELLEGWVVPKMVRGPEHDAVLSLLAVELLGPILPLGWFCRIQSALTTADSETEPDLAVVRGRPRDYRDRHPGPNDTALVIEVAESSIARDRAVKARIYAGAGIPAYWIVNLADRRVEVFTQPARESAYERLDPYAPGDTIPIEVGGHSLPGIAVSELFPESS